jgi:hypothetical protein
VAAKHQSINILKRTSQFLGYKSAETGCIQHASLPENTV